jgi:hypothetical protein
MIRFVLLSDRCGFVNVGRPLWRENGAVAYNCQWSSPAKSFLSPSPTRLSSYFTVSDSRLLQPVGPGPRVYIPQEQDGPVIPPGTGLTPCFRLELEFFLRPTVSRPVRLGIGPLFGILDQIFTLLFLLCLTITFFFFSNEKTGPQITV